MRALAARMILLLIAVCGISGCSSSNKATVFREVVGRDVPSEAVLENYVPERRFRESRHLFILRFDSRDAVDRFLSAASMKDYVGSAEVDNALARVRSFVAYAAGEASLKAEADALKSVHAEDVFSAWSASRAFGLTAVRRGTVIYLLAE